MRVLIANCYLHVVGGAETYLQTIVPALRDRGYQIAIVYTYREQEGVARIDQQTPVSVTWCVETMGQDAVLNAIRAWQPDVVYNHGLQPLALKEALLDAYPTVLFAHDYFGSCVSGRKCHSFPQFEVCERRFGAGCLALYGLRRCGGRNPLTAIRLWQQETWRNRLLRACNHVLVASQHMRAEMMRNGVLPDKVTVAGLPVAEPEVSVRARDRHEGRIIMLSRLTDLKGGEYLISAVHIAERLMERPLRLTMVGTGSEEPRLRKLARGNTRITFAGWVQGEQRRDLLRQSDLLAVPSVWPEPFGLVGLEAARFGVPAVAFDVGGIPDWLIGGESGELAPSNPISPAGLALAIARAFHDDAHYSTLSAGALRVSQRFTLQKHLALVEQSLSAVVEQSASAARYVD